MEQNVKAMIEKKRLKSGNISATEKTGKFCNKYLFITRRLRKTATFSLICTLFSFYGPITRYMVH